MDNIAKEKEEDTEDENYEFDDLLPTEQKDEQDKQFAASVEEMMAKEPAIKSIDDVTKPIEEKMITLVITAKLVEKIDGSDDVRLDHGPPVQCRDG